MPGVFVIVRDARGSLVHVRRRDTGACIGCIETGLFEVVRAALLAERAMTAAAEGTAAAATGTGASVRRERRRCDA
ncbi:MAG: hypothetical protein ACYC9X_11920 [Dehalococcoidia bacterium]